MINLEEIEKEIQALEQQNTTYAVVERLSWLITVKNYLTAKNQNVLPVSTVSAKGKSELMQIIHGMPDSDAWAVMDELVEVVKIVNPKLYNSFIQKLDKAKSI